MSTATPGPCRTAVVTGAGRGIGRALAVGLARSGVAVALLGRRRTPALEEVLEHCRAFGVQAVAVEADVRDYEAVCAAVAQAVGVLGPLDLLVNNAGVIDPVEVPVWEADPQQWWDVVETDLRGPFHCVRAVVPGMVASGGGGRVIDLNSGAGASDRDVYSAYCAAKAGLFRIAGSLHLAGYERGIRAFEISPGVVTTDMTASMAMHEGRTEWTPVEAVVDLVVAAARGELDDWSGCFLRAGVDTPAGLRAAVASGKVTAASDARWLRVQRYGPSDPLTP